MVVWFVSVLINVLRQLVMKPYVLFKITRLIEMRDLAAIKSSLALLISKMIIACLGIVCYSVNAGLPYVEAVETTNTIQGSAPYISFDGGKTRSFYTDNLLSITLPDERKFTKATNTSSKQAPIQLNGESISAKDFKTLIPENQTSVSLTEVFATNGFWFDQDGDGDITATGDLMLSIQDANGKSVALDNELTDCYAPYSFTLNHMNGTLSTKYGQPNTVAFDANSTTYYFSPPNGACTYSAEPNLSVNDSKGNSWGGTDYSGPENQWDDAKGFKRQSLTHPELNFPTMGENGLFFYLNLFDSSAPDMSFDKIPADSAINLTITGNGSKAKIQLTGPTSSADAAQAAKAAVATTFILYKDKAKTNKIYAFTIQKWFIVQAENTSMLFDQAKQYCDNLGYQIPTLLQLTNANYNTIWTGGLPGLGRHYQRRIDGGLFSQWGETNNYYYPESHFISGAVYWSANSFQEGGKTYYLQVHSNIGMIDYWTDKAKVACISPN